MSKQNNIVPLSRFRAALARPRGYRRVEQLVVADDPAAEIAKLSVPEIYGLVKEVGFADTLELVAHATPEQIRGCVDLDSWDRDRVQTDAVMPWLAAVAEAGFEKLGRVWDSLDPELCALILARTTRIYDLSLGEEVDDSVERPVYTTPDRFFAVELCSDSEDDVALVHRILEDLYRADMQLARHTLMSARSELTAELEEMSYRWRSGRMADLGYPDFYDALEVFRPLDPSSVVIGEDSAETIAAPETDDPDDQARAPGHLPAPVLQQAVGRAFLARALDQVTDAAEAERLEAALLMLVNQVLAAARVSPGDSEAIEIGSEHATATLALGLESVSKGSLDAAVEALRTVSLVRMHRVGYTIGLRLSRYAKQIAVPASTAGEPTASIMPALLAARPFYHTALDDPAGVDIRPFESLDDVRRTAEHLTELALRIAIAGAVGLDVAALAQQPQPRPELDDYIRTALVRAAAGGELAASPLSIDDLIEFRDTALSGGDVGAGATRKLSSALVAQLDEHGITAGREHLPKLVSRWSEHIAETLSAEDLDPRYIGGLILTADKA